MKTLSTVLADAILILEKSRIASPRKEAEEILAEMLHCSRGELYIDREQEISPEMERLCHDWIEERLKGKPLAYLAGKVDFYDCQFEINPSVLIPRPETEILVDKIENALVDIDLHGKTLWDLCCGSGCIGIALKKAFPALTVSLSDISPQAIDLAKRNATKNAVEVECLLGDLLEPFQGKRVDFVVCNPPYISAGEYALLDKEVKDFEPCRALLAGESGLEFYRRLAKDLPCYLKPTGKAWFEIGYRQGNEVQKLFQGHPWGRSVVEKDWSGHDRFFLLEIE